MTIHQWVQAQELRVFKNIRTGALLLAILVGSGLRTTIALPPVFLGDGRYFMLTEPLPPAAINNNDQSKMVTIRQAFRPQIHADLFPAHMKAYNLPSYNNQDIGSRSYYCPGLLVFTGGNMGLEFAILNQCFHLSHRVSQAQRHTRNASGCSTALNIGQSLEMGE